MIAPGSTVWFARHESRLAWRDWLAMMTAGKSARRRAVAIGIAAFIIIMHAVAYLVVGGFATAVPDQHMLIGITTTLLLSWLLMVSQAMESMTRAFYARADLDLILASPVAAEKIFAVRIATVALSVAAMALPLAAPFIDMLAVRGGRRGQDEIEIGARIKGPRHRLHRLRNHEQPRQQQRRGDRDQHLFVGGGAGGAADQ